MWSTGHTRVALVTILDLLLSFLKNYILLVKVNHKYEVWILVHIISVVSDSVRPHRRQTTRLCCPWDSPGKNTGMGCHFLLQCMKMKSEVIQSCPLLVTPWTAAHQAPPFMWFSRQEYWSGVPLPAPIAFSSTHNCQQNIKSFLGKDKSYTSKTFFFYTQWLLLHLKLPDTSKHSTKLSKPTQKIQQK